MRVDFSRPGKPTDNAAIESFHNSFRRECLTQHYFIDITDAQQQIALNLNLPRFGGASISV